MTSAQQPTAGSPADEVGSIDAVDLIIALLLQWKTIVFGPLLAGLVALGATFLIPKTYTSRAVFLPLQQQQSAAAAALAQLGSLSGLIGGTGAVRTPGDQYVSLMQSQTVADRIVDAFGLISVYGVEYRFEARKQLAANVRISLGRKDGLITIEVDDRDPQRAADIANRYVDELRRLSADLALTEAQQRRAFLEQQLSLTRERLAQAQKALQGSGFSQGALNADARAAAEAYARIRAEITSAEIRLQTMRVRLADTTPEVQQAVSTLMALRSQLERAESGARSQQDGESYISKFREFKYQETLFDLFARQYELARVDESRDGALIQVVDVAKPAERKSRPQRALITATATAASAVVFVAFVFWRHFSARRAGPTLRARLRAARVA